MKVQLGIFLVFLTLSTVLAQITSASPQPERHEKNRCRPPNCHRGNDNQGKKIADQDEAPVVGNELNLDQSSTTAATTTTTTIASSTTEKRAENLVISSTTTIASTTSAPNITEENVSSSSSNSSPSTTTAKFEDLGQIGGNQPAENVTEGSSTAEPSIGMLTDNSTEEIRIPVEVKIIPPSRDELGGLTGHCPKPFRYHNETGKCFIPGNKDHPCGELMQFYAEPETEAYGTCDCKHFVGCDYRPVVYYIAADRCFHLFDQGPCKSGEWLTIGAKSEAVCSKRNCPASDDGTDAKKWFQLDGTCYQLGTKAFCQNPLETAQYEQGNFVPSCSLSIIKTAECAATSLFGLTLGTKSLSIGAPSLSCGPGKKSTGSGSCGTVVGF